MFIGFPISSGFRCFGAGSGFCRAPFLAVAAAAAFFFFSRALFNERLLRGLESGGMTLSFIHKWFERPVRIQATQSRSLSFFGFQPKWVEALVAVLWLDYCSRRVVSARP